MVKEKFPIEGWRNLYTVMKKFKEIVSFNMKAFYTCRHKSLKYFTYQKQKKTNQNKYKNKDKSNLLAIVYNWTH